MQKAQRVRVASLAVEAKGPSIRSYPHHSPLDADVVVGGAGNLSSQRGKMCLEHMGGVGKLDWQCLFILR